MKKTAEEILDDMHSTFYNDEIPVVKYDVAIEAMHEFANQSRWISVKDRLPEELASVLLCTDKSYVTQGYITGLKTKDGNQIWHETYIGNQYHNVILWQPLPTAPREEANNDTRIQ